MTNGHLGLTLDYLDAERGIITADYTELLSTAYAIELQHILLSDSRFTILKSNDINLVGSSFDESKFLAWATWLANKSGVESAQSSINNFLNTFEVEVLTCVGISGVKVEHSIPLFYNITLESMHSTGNLLFDQYTSASGRHYFYNPTHSILMHRSKINLLHKSDGKLENTNLGNNLAWSLYEISYLMSFLNGVSCIPVSQFTYSPINYPYGPFSGGGGATSIHDERVAEAKDFNEALIGNLMQLFDKYSNMKEKERDRWRLISKRLARAKFQNYIENKFLDLGISAEMMLLNNLSEKQQLAFTFKLRGAYLLADTNQDRKEIFSQLGRLYDYRSQVAHSGMLEKSNLQKIYIAQSEFSTHLSLVERIARKLIIDSEPDWETLILSGL